MSSSSLDKLIFGTASITSHPTLRKALSVLEHAAAAGIMHIDTAPAYGRGYAEIIVGRFLKRNRSAYLLSTKFGLGDPGTPSLPAFAALPFNFLKKTFTRGNFIHAPGKQTAYRHRVISKEEIKAQLRNSLLRLGTDYIDYYLLHEGLPSFLTREALDYLMDQRRKGVVRYIGLAANRLNTAALNGQDLAGWDVVQYDAENGSMLHFPGTASIPRHFHHSTLSNLKTDGAHPGVSPRELAGYILALSAKNNPTGKIIFATRDTERLKANIDSFLKFSATT